MELSILYHCDRRPQNSPQLAILTFDGAVNLNNMKYYDELLKLKGKVGNIFLIRWMCLVWPLWLRRLSYALELTIKEFWSFLATLFVEMFKKLDVLVHFLSFMSTNQNTLKSQSSSIAASI